MSDGSEPVTPPQDTGMPDSAETDPAALNSAEDLDEDRLQVDPLEEGVEPPEHWSEADRYGTTPFEQQQGESLEQRVRQEEPDIGERTEPGSPRTSAPATGLDEAVDETVDDDGNPVPRGGSDTVDYLTEDAEPVHSGGTAADPDTPAARRGQNADQVGGSVADAIRTPDDTEDGRR